MQLDVQVKRGLALDMGEMPVETVGRPPRSTRRTSFSGDCDCFGNSSAAVDIDSASRPRWTLVAIAGLDGRAGQGPPGPHTSHGSVDRTSLDRLGWTDSDRHRAGLHNPAACLVYDPAAAVWSVLPKAPVCSRTDAIAVWTGSRLIIRGGRGVRDPFQDYVDGAVYQP